MEAFEGWQPYCDVLIVDLGEKAIKGVGDVYRLFDEVEGLYEDYPEYKLIMFKVNGTP